MSAKRKAEPEAKSLKIVNGDIIKCDADFIVQQCNCLTVTAHGLSASIAAAHPNADAYKHRRRLGKRNLAIPEDRDRPGTMKILDTKVVCLFGQWRPGRIETSYFSTYPESPDGVETAELRKTWFQRALDEFGTVLDKKEGSVKVAFPMFIGCGLAGGDWKEYKKMIDRFAEVHPQAEIVLVKL